MRARRRQPKPKVKPGSESVTLAQYQQRTLDYIEGTARDLGGIIEQLGGWDELVKSELRRRHLDPDGGEAGMDELAVSMDLAFALGVCVGRTIGGAR